MVYLVSFGIFLLFMLCMALSLIFKRGSLKSESEAHALLEGINCAACTNSACSKSDLLLESCAAALAAVLWGP